MLFFLFSVYTPLIAFGMGAHKDILQLTGHERVVSCTSQISCFRVADRVICRSQLSFKSYRVFLFPIADDPTSRRDYNIVNIQLCPRR